MIQMILLRKLEFCKSSSSVGSKHLVSQPVSQISPSDWFKTNTPSSTFGISWQSASSHRWCCCYSCVCYKLIVTFGTIIIIVICIDAVTVGFVWYAEEVYHLHSLTSLSLSSKSCISCAWAWAYSIHLRWFRCKRYWYCSDSTVMSSLLLWG